MKVIVCGGRDFNNETAVNLVLNKFHKKHPISMLIHGGASGADSLAGMWAEKNLIPCKVYPADWVAHGRAAGPIRNQMMLDAEKPFAVIALPGGRGTEDMRARASASGVNVWAPLSNRLNK